MAAKESISLSSRVGAILARHRRPLIWGMSGTVFIIIAIFSYLEVQQRRANEALMLVEEVEVLFDQWSDARDSEDEQSVLSLRQQLDGTIDEVLRRFPRKYAANRARLIQGDVAWHSEEWGRAGELYRETASTFPRSHIAPLSLYNAAASFEEAGEIEAAAESLTELVDRYSETPSPLVPQALLSLGRIREGEENFVEAQEFYQRLVEEHPASSWTSLARNRMILLSAQGRLD